MKVGENNELEKEERRREMQGFRVKLSLLIKGNILIVTNMKETEGATSHDK